ncbi:MAG: hypothetical protein WCX84_08795 [Syntrophales bacterium]|nr:hypothetical protein [Syntrophales bacterium]NLN59344.1 V-type ATP synthase subunit E [Deltaproteobacteria bacterium]
MEIHVKELIEKIRNDGVKDAEAKASAIIDEAELKAQAIVARAKDEASQITEKAREEAQKSEQAGREILKQAGRDLILNLQARIIDLFNIIVKEEVSAAMDDKIMGETIVRLIGSWKEDISNLQIVLGVRDYQDLEMHLREKLAQEIQKGLEIHPSPTLESGFFVAVKNGSAYHNFSAEGMAAVLSESLNPRLSALLSEGLKDKPEG